MNIRPKIQSLDTKRELEYTSVVTKTENDEEIVVLVYVDDLMILSEAKLLERCVCRNGFTSHSFEIIQVRIDSDEIVFVRHVLVDLC
jgi:hypothetical protein